MVAEDLNADGAPDVIAAYNNAGRSIITVQFGNLEAYAPKFTETFKAIQAGNPPPALLPDTEAFAVPEAPDLLAVGDFNRDGSKDVLMAARDGGLYVLDGDGQGNLADARQIDVPGRVTALAVGNINEADGLTDVAVAIDGAEGPSVLIFDGAAGGFNAKPVSYDLPASATSIAIGGLDSDANADLAVAAGANIAIIHGRDRDDTSSPQTRVELIPTSTHVEAVVVGRFIYDRAGRQEIAALTDDGYVQLLQRGELDPRPLAQEEIERQHQRLRELAGKQTDRAARGPQWQPGKETGFTLAQELNFRVADAAGTSAAKVFFAAQMTRSQTEDLVVLDAAQRQLNILRTEELAPAPASSKTNAPAQAAISPVTLDVASAPVAAATLPFRAGGQELLILREGAANVASVLNAPLATITVDRTDDVVVSGCTAAANDCSLRGAAAFANANPGTQINLAATNYNLTISGGVGTTQGSGEGFSGNNSIGDLDIRGNNTSFVGAGAASTTITQTTPVAGSPSNDRVIETNPDLVLNFIVNVTGLKLTGGKTPDGGGALVTGGDPGGNGMGTSTGNVATVSSCNLSGNQSFGGSSPGGAIWNIGGGDLIVMNSTFQTNSSNPSSGGAINNANVNNYLGKVQISGSTFGGASAGLGNTAAGTANSGGGCISITDFADAHSISNTTFQNNTTTTGSAGGGVLVSASGSWTITGSTFTSNSNSSGLAGSGGGAIAITGGNLTVNNACTFTSNTTNGGFGGGAILLTSSTAGGHTISGGTGTTTFTSNTSTGSTSAGGALYIAPTTNITSSKLDLSSNSTSGSVGGGALAFVPNAGTPGSTPTYSLTLSQITGNTVTNASGGGGAILMSNAGTLNANFNRFVNNTSTTAANGNTVRRTAGTANVTDDWWGNQGPKTNDVSGTVTTSPFLQLEDDGFAFNYLGHAGEPR